MSESTAIPRLRPRAHLDFFECSSSRQSCSRQEPTKSHSSRLEAFAQASAQGSFFSRAAGVASLMRSHSKIITDRNVRESMGHQE